MPFYNPQIYAGMPQEDLDLIMMGIVAQHEEDLIAGYELDPADDMIEDIVFMAEVKEITYGELK